MCKSKLRNPGSLGLCCIVITGALLAAQPAVADMSYGEMAAAIRSANYPCAHVLNVDSAGDNAWVVQCNSGTFKVFRDENGDFQVTPADQNAD